MNKLVIGVIGTATLSVISLASNVVNTIRMNRTLKKLNDGLGKVEEISEDKISETVIQTAVNRAANKQVEAHLKATESAVIRAADEELAQKAREAVYAQAKDIRKQAAEKISQQVANLDIEALKTRVCDESNKIITKKLEGVLDESAKKFQDQMDQTRKIYDKISKAMAEKEEDNDSVLVFRI